MATLLSHRRINGKWRIFSCVGEFGRNEGTVWKGKKKKKKEANSVEWNEDNEPQ